MGIVSCTSPGDEFAVAGSASFPDGEYSILMDTPHGPEVFRVWVEAEVAWLADDVRLGDIEDFTVVEDGYEPSSLEELGAPIGAGKILLGKLWPENGSNVIEIPFVFGPNCTDEQVYYTLAGLEHWEERTDGYLDFVMHAYPYQGDPSDNRIFVNCTFDTGCSVNFVGMYPVAPFNILWMKECVDWETVTWDCVGNGDCGAGETPVDLDEDASIIHETGHILGQYHEQQRQDRDNHVTYYSDAVKDAKEHNWLQHSNVNWDFGPFNFQSFMLYNSCQHNTDDNCKPYHNGTLADEDPNFDPIADYVKPSMLRVPYTDPCYYDLGNPADPNDDQRCPGIFWREGRYLDDFPNDKNGGELYTFARQYKKTWHISNDGDGILSPLHFRHEWGSAVDSRFLIVGKFCDDDMSNRPNNDDILWKHNISDKWYVVCDGGWHSWEHGEGARMITETDMEDVLVGDFDGYEQTSDSDEWFTDVLRNDPSNGKWEWLLNGELSTDWDPVPVANPPRTDDVGDLKVGTFCFNSVELGIRDVLLKNSDNSHWYVSCGAVAQWADLGVTYGELEYVLLADVNGDGYSDILRNDMTSGDLELALATPPPSPPPGMDALCSYSGFAALNLHPGSENQDVATLEWDATVFGPGRFYDDGVGLPGEDLLYRIDESRDVWWVADSDYLELHELYWREMNDFRSDVYPDTPMQWDAPPSYSRADLVIGWFTTPSGDAADDADFDDVVVSLPSVKNGEI